jgi:hypothetical protein
MANALVNSFIVLVNNTLLRVFEIQNKYFVLSVTDQESFVFVEF